MYFILMICCIHSIKKIHDATVEFLLMAYLPFNLAECIVNSVKIICAETSKSKDKVK